METETQEPLTDEFIAELRGAWSNANIIESHWQGCEYSHSHCAVVRLCDEVMRLRELQEKLAMAESAMDEALGNIQTGCLFYPPPQSLPRATIIEIGLRLKKALEDIRNGS